MSDSSVLTGLGRETLADQAYTALREAIAVGELAQGAKITERGLAERLSVSPTPVREAIRRLEQDGLVERTGPRSVRVAEATPSTLAELAEAEAALRGLVARFAATKATSDQLDRLDSLLDEADEHLTRMRTRQAAGLPAGAVARQLLGTLQRFNRLTETCAGNPALVQLLNHTRVFTPAERLELTLERLERDTQLGAARYGQHRALVRAMRDRDAARAEQIAAGHAADALTDLQHEAP